MVSNGETPSILTILSAAEMCDMLVLLHCYGVQNLLNPTNIFFY